jgi:hypothetical protein
VVTVGIALQGLCIGLGGSACWSLPLRLPELEADDTAQSISVNVTYTEGKSDEQKTGYSMCKGFR